jgi:hypothetical protein
MEEPKIIRWILGVTNRTPDKDIAQIRWNLTKMQTGSAVLAVRQARQFGLNLELTIAQCGGSKTRC